MKAHTFRVAFVLTLLIALAVAIPAPQGAHDPDADEGTVDPATIPGTGRNLKNKVNVTPMFKTPKSGNPSEVEIWSDDGPDPDSKKPIEYHGGEVLTDDINVYMIYYGDWSQNMDDLKILEDLVKNLGNTTYWSTVKNYYNAANVKIKGNLKLAGTVLDDYSFGSEISVFSMPYVVGAGILKAKWTPNPKAIYVIVASVDVWHQSGYCSSFCGFHTFDTILSKSLKYIYLGTPTTECLSGCGPVYTKYPSPNRKPAIDAMASTLVHEIAETASNPVWNDRTGSWYDADGWEMADKCVWQFGVADGQVTSESDGTKWNVRVGSRKYLLQQLWDNTSQKCAKVR